jgi:hypothetical protein
MDINPYSVGLIYFPLAVIFGGVAVGMADETFDLHVGEKMAHVRVDPDANELTQIVQDVVRQVGQAAVDAEK